MINTAEALLALRAPGADWLATLVTALDESGRDPEFNPHLAQVFADLAQRAASDGALPSAIIEAAHRRTRDFTRRLTEDLAEQPAAEEQTVVHQRPHLSLVAS